MCIFVPTQWDAVCASPAVADMDRDAPARRDVGRVAGDARRRSS